MDSSASGFLETSLDGCLVSELDLLLALTALEAVTAAKLDGRKSELTVSCHNEISSIPRSGEYNISWCISRFSFALSTFYIKQFVRKPDFFLSAVSGLEILASPVYLSATNRITATSGKRWRKTGVSILVYV